MSKPAQTEEVPMDDAQAVRAFLETGDAAAFQLLVTRHKERVFRLAVSILGPGCEAEAEEVAQEVFLQVFRQLPHFRMESRFSTWLYRIAYNRAVDHRKRRRREPHLGEESLLELPDLRRRTDPFGVTAVAENRRLLAQCLQQLPELYRAVMHLYYWQGCAVAEIGDLLGAPPNTVKSYLHRARQLLERELAKRGVRHA